MMSLVAVGAWAVVTLGPLVALVVLGGVAFWAIMGPLE